MCIKSVLKALHQCWGMTFDSDFNHHKKCEDAYSIYSMYAHAADGEAYGARSYEPPTLDVEKQDPDFDPDNDDYTGDYGFFIIHP